VEIIEATGGGVLYEPNSAEALAATVAELLADEDRRFELGRLGRASVERDFSMAAAVERMIRLYESER